MANPTSPRCRSTRTTNSVKKRGIGKNSLLAIRTVMLQEQVDMVAGDFNGAAWRRKRGEEHRRDSTIEEACDHM